MSIDFSYDNQTYEWQLPSFELNEFAPKKASYCVCIPIINEGSRIISQLEKMSQLGIHQQIDIILLDGGSTDGSTAAERLQSLGVRSLLIKTGSGKLSAQLRMGLAYALKQGYEGIVTVDGNNKDGIEAIPDFIAELAKGADFVQGSRYIRGGKAINTPLIRMLAIHFLHAPIISITAGFHYTDTTNGFRGISRRYLMDNRVQPFREIFMTYELLAYLSVRASQLQMKTLEIPVTRAYPKEGKMPTKISFLQGHLSLIKILFQVLIHKFDPALS